MELLLIVLFVMVAGEWIRRRRALRVRAERLALSRVEAIAQVYARRGAS